MYITIGVSLCREKTESITRRGVPLPREKRYNTIGVFLQLIYGQQGWSHPRWFEVQTPNQPLALAKGCLHFFPTASIVWVASLPPPLPTLATSNDSSRYGHVWVCMHDVTQKSCNTVGVFLQLIYRQQGWSHVGWFEVQTPNQPLPLAKGCLHFFLLQA